MQSERKPTSAKSPLTWAALAALVATSGCPSLASCPDDGIDPDDQACEGKGGCDMVPVDDAGVADGGDVPQRFCGCCNG